MSKGSPFIWATTLEKEETDARESIDVSSHMKATFLKGEAAKNEEDTLTEEKPNSNPSMSFS